MGRDRSLLMGHDAQLLQQTVGDILLALSHMALLFDDAVSGTGWSELVTRSQQMNCQSKQNRADTNHQSSDH